MDLISNRLGVEKEDYISEEELLKAIKSRVEHLLDTEPELLMSYLYRLDVLEVKIKAILDKSSPLTPVEGLSRLILERQKERAATKAKYKQPPIDGWNW